MPKVKIYEWRGVSSLSLSLLIDGNRKDIDFPPGKEKPRVNARYECSNEGIQAKIEETQLFQTGKIKLFREYVTEDPKVTISAPAAEAKKPATPTGKGVSPSVTTYQQAASKLHEKFGVSMEQLQDPEAIMSEAAKNGASFPNLIL
jgi:hypothetical protein